MIAGLYPIVMKSNCRHDKYGQKQDIKCGGKQKRSDGLKDGKRNDELFTNGFGVSDPPLKGVLVKFVLHSYTSKRASCLTICRVAAKGAHRLLLI